MLIDFPKVLLLVFLFISGSVSGQGVEVLIKFEVNSGNLQDTRITLSENGSVIETISPAKSKNVTQLKFDKDYVLSFEKPGYITKRVAVNTKNVPEEIKGINLDFDFAVEIFEQYEGLNTVVFNQPVARWFYDAQEDEFTYDTDYTKSIRSALVDFDKQYEKAQLTGKSKQSESKAPENPVQVSESQPAVEPNASQATLTEKTNDQPKEEPTVDVESDKDKEEKARQEKLLEQQQLEAKGRSEEEARQERIKAEEERKRELQERAEAEDRAAKAKMEEEAAAKQKPEVTNEPTNNEKAQVDEEERARKKLKLEAEIRAAEEAARAEEKRRAEIEQLEIERRQREADARRAEEERLAAKKRAEEERKKQQEATRAEEERKRLEASEAAFEAERQRKAKEAYEAEQRAMAKAKAVAEAQERERSEALAKMEEERKSLSVKDAGAVITRTEEEIVEHNRTITQITIVREFMTYVYKKVVYSWGGIYYFRDDDSITKAVFELETKN